jgi:hypothetical protein
MIGDGYFQLRARIGTSLYSLASLARDLADAGSEIASIQPLQTRLREPFLFVVIGERGAGKSALLNALFERDFASDPLFAGRAVTYRYGVDPREEVRGDGTIEIQRPWIFLRDFTLVEIPGFGAPETWTPLLPPSDLVLVVLPVKGDPAAALGALAPLDREALRRCVFVVQQCDSVAAFELPPTIERLRHHMLLQLGCACPMFPVSAHTRYGLDKLDRHIDREIVVSPARCRSLREICEIGREILASLGARSQAALEAAARLQQRLDEEMLALGARRDQSLRLAADALWALTRLFDSTQSRVLKLLDRKLTLLNIWSERPEWWREFHAELETRLRESITRNLAATFEKFEADLQGAWKQHRDALRDLHIAPCPPFSHDATALLARLTADLAACDLDGVATRSAQRVYVRARRQLRLPSFAVALSALILGAAMFASKFVVAAAALAVVCLVALLIMYRLVRSKALGALLRLMAGRRERVLSFFEQELRSELDRFYGTLAGSFRDAESAGPQSAAVHEPALGRLRQIEELFERCSAEIATRRASAPDAQVAEEVPENAA